MTQASTPERFGEFVSIARHGRVVEVVYDRGDGLNALSVQGMTELRDAARSLSDDTQSAVIVLAGRGTFSAGADLNDPGLRDQSTSTLLQQRVIARLGPDMCQAWADLEQITITAIEGFCIGGGLALAAACDHRVLSRSAHLRLPEVPLGMNMSWRTIPRLTALIGPSRTKQLVILGRRIDASKALDWGLVDELAEPGETGAAAQALADDYAKLPPLALRMTKQAIDASAHALGYATSFMDRDQFLLARQSKDHSEAVSAFFEKRAPKFTGD